MHEQKIKSLPEEKKAEKDAIREKEEAEKKQKEIEMHRQKIAQIGAENLPVIPAKITNTTER